jgi:hypothetical protein
MTRLTGHAAVAASIVLLALGGCGLADDSAGGPPAAAARPYPTGTPVRAAPPPQPYDIFRGDLLGRVDHAMLILRDKCLARSGFPQLAEAGPGDVRRIHPHLRVSLSDFGLASEAEARQRGFGQDLPGEPRRVLSKDANFDASMQRCAAEAWHAIGPRAWDVYRQYDELGGLLTEALATVHQAPTPAKMAAGLADCVDPHYRIPDRAAWLKDPSVKAFGVRFGDHVDPPEAAWKPTGAGSVEIGPAIPARRYVPTPEESELAVVWFRCTDKVGLQRHRTDAAMAAQRAAVTKHEARFEALNPQVEALARQAAILVGAS